MAIYNGENGRSLVGRPVVNTVPFTPLCAPVRNVAQKEQTYGCIYD